MAEFVKTAEYDVRMAGASVLADQASEGHTEHVLGCLLSSPRFFYQCKLLDGAGIDAVSKGAAFHSQPAFGPFVVWDCQDGRESGGGRGGSMQNPAEAELAATLVAGGPARGCVRHKARRV